MGQHVNLCHLRTSKYAECKAAGSKLILPNISFKWREYKEEDEPEVTSGNMRFRDVDENNNQRIGKGEFKKFYERLIKD